MAKKSTRNKPRRKPTKHRRDFPLSANGNGQWSNENPVPLLRVLKIRAITALHSELLVGVPASAGIRRLKAGLQLPEIDTKRCEDVLCRKYREPLAAIAAALGF